MVVLIWKDLAILNVTQFSIISVEPYSVQVVFSKIKNSIFRQTILHVKSHKLVSVKTGQAVIS